MNISSTTISGSLYIPNTRNAVAKGMSQAASTKFSREDTVEISGKKDAENTLCNYRVREQHLICRTSLLKP